MDLACECKDMATELGGGCGAGIGPRLSGSKSWPFSVHQ